MKLRRRAPLNRTLCIGLVLLSVANVSRMVLERHTSMPEGPRDAIFGLLYGLAIGATILGIWRTRHPAGHSDDGRRA